MATPISPSGPPLPIKCHFEVKVSKEAFKFNAAHFVAFRGYRERLHGHNYQVSVRLIGSRKIWSDGYLLDFGDVKKVAKSVCKELNEHFLCPSLSDVLQIEEDADYVKITCEDGTFFVIPKSDCVMLPIVHATTEELGVYLWGRILEDLDADVLLQRGICEMEVTVAEAAGQEAAFRMMIPKKEFNLSLDVKDYIVSHDIVASACRSLPSCEHEDEGINVLKNIKKKGHDEDCGEVCSNCIGKLSKKLDALAVKVKSGEVEMNIETLKAYLLENHT